MSTILPTFSLKEGPYLQPRIRCRTGGGEKSQTMAPWCLFLEPEGLTGSERMDQVSGWLGRRVNKACAYKDSARADEAGLSLSANGGGANVSHGHAAGRIVSCGCSGPNSAAGPACWCFQSQREGLFPGMARNFCYRNQPKQPCLPLKEAFER